MYCRNKQLLSGITDGCRLTAEHHVRTETEEISKEVIDVFMNADTRLKHEAHVRLNLQKEADFYDIKYERVVQREIQKYQSATLLKYGFCSSYADPNSVVGALQAFALESTAKAPPLDHKSQSLVACQKN